MILWGFRALNSVFFSLQPFFFCFPKKLFSIFLFLCGIENQDITLRSCFIDKW